MARIGRRPFLQVVTAWTGIAAAGATSAGSATATRAGPALNTMFKPGVRYRMPAVFGPAPGPRQKADGTQWTVEETGTMTAQSLVLRYLTNRSKLVSLLPPGFTLRGEPVVTVSISFFDNLYWLAGRGYGIVGVNFPVTYAGKHETIAGSFCPVMWEGIPDAIMTGREELGFPKLFADIPRISHDPQRRTAATSASWFGHTFVEAEVHDLTETTAQSPEPGEAALFLKYMPRTSISGKEGADSVYVTTSRPPPGSAGAASAIDSRNLRDYKRWTAQGSVKWHRATFAQLPTTFHVINSLADLEIIGYRGAEMTQYSAPGISVWANSMRAVEPA